MTKAPRSSHKQIQAYLAFCAIAALTGTGAASASDWKIQEIALMAQVRCLYSGGHMNRSQVTKYIAQVNSEQHGQFQRVYDTSFTGVPRQVNSMVEGLLASQGGCRKMMSEWVYSKPDTPFKRSIEMDWMLKQVRYFDE